MLFHIKKVLFLFYFCALTVLFAYFQTFVCLGIMFAIQWGYALANISVTLVIYIYIAQANPGVFPGKLCILSNKLRTF